jgi:hypothetical protein
MKSKYLAFVIVVSLVHLFCFYYTIVFCAVYPTSSVGWLYSAIQGLMFGWFFFEIITSLGSAIVRVLVRKFPKIA